MKTLQEIHDMLPENQEFNSTHVNRLLGDKRVMVSYHDTIPYRVEYEWSIDTEKILTEMRDKGMVSRGSGDHCFWYTKIPKDHYLYGKQIK